MSTRVVVKIGSSSLTSAEGGLNRDAVAFFANEIAALKKEGAEVLLVTSGAVAAGFRAIGYQFRPKLLHEKQAAAAVGQALLMQAYQEAFAAHGITTAQILLTRTDFGNRKRMNNAGMTIEELLKQGSIPIINENDTVSVDELKFGDNDTLSALVANLVKAQNLLILTDMDGLYTGDPRKHPNAVRFDHIEEITEEIYAIAGGAVLPSERAECAPKWTRPKSPCAAAFPSSSARWIPAGICGRRWRETAKERISIRPSTRCR